MSFGELIARIFSGMRPLLPSMIAVVVCTVAALTVLAFMSRGVWVDDERFPVAGLFFGLDGKSVLTLTCAWLKLLLPIVFLVSFQKPAPICYVAFLIPAVLLTALSGNGKKIAESLFWTVLQTAGLVSAGLVYGYYKEVSKGIGVLLIYIAITFFMIVFGVYLFLLEVNAVSGGRRIVPKEIWGKKADETVE